MAPRRFKRGVQGKKVIRQRRVRPTQAPVQSLDLNHAAFDPERLARQTYLTIPEFCAYAPFQTKNAAYRFLRDHAEVPTLRQGRRKVIVRRADYDRFLAASEGARPSRDR